MRTLDLLPTKDNLINTFNEDILDRNRSVYFFLNLLNEFEGPITIAINGYWGSGKTFFVKQTKMIIDCLNPNTLGFDNNERKVVKDALRRICLNNDFEQYQPQVAVYYDAWENDNDTDPVLSIVYSIIKEIGNTNELCKSPSFLKIVGSIVDCITGREVLKTFEAFKAGNSLEEIEKQKNLRLLIFDFFKELLPEHGNRLVVFIDELDRCSPAYAVQLLERIKHYFQIEEVTFVFSVNLEELQHTIKKCYGNDFNAGRYLDRFFDLRISMPPAKLDRYYQKLGLLNESWVYEKECRYIIEKLHLELREISRFYTIARIAAYKPTHRESEMPSFPEEKATKYNFLYIVPLMIGLQMSNLSLYEEFIHGKNCKPLIDIIKADSHFESTMRNFLCTDETFAIADEKHKHVTVDELIERWYAALFIQVYDNNVYEIAMGQLSFNKQHQNELFEVTSLLSRYSSTEQLVQ